MWRIKMSSKQFTSKFNNAVLTTKTILHFVLYTIVTDKEATATCYGSWMKKVNLNDGVLHNMLFSSTEKYNSDCAKKCGITEFCTYYGFDDTDGTCRGYSKRGNMIKIPSKLQIWQKSCRYGYGYMTEPRWCIKSYDELMVRDQAALFCAMKKSRLAIINSEEKKTFATNYLNADYISSSGYHIGGTYDRMDDAWYWDTGEFLDTSLPSANDPRIESNSLCASMWDETFLEIPCRTEQFVLCEEL